MITKEKHSYRVLFFRDHGDRETSRLLLLRVVSGFTAAETGAMLGMSAEAVRVAQHRALARLPKLLAGEPG